MRVEWFSPMQFIIRANWQQGTWRPNIVYYVFCAIRAMQVPVIARCGFTAPSPRRPATRTTSWHKICTPSPARRARSLLFDICAPLHPSAVPLSPLLHCFPASLFNYILSPIKIESNSFLRHFLLPYKSVVDIFICLNCFSAPPSPSVIFFPELSVIGAPSWLSAPPFFRAFFLPPEKASKKPRKFVYSRRLNYDTDFFARIFRGVFFYRFSVRALSLVVRCSSLKLDSLACGCGEMAASIFNPMRGKKWK